MHIWKVKEPIIPGKSYASVNKIARGVFHQIERKTKRKPYLRSKYFQKQKVFLSFFWDHLSSKTVADKIRRLKLFPCGLELIRDSSFSPTEKVNPNNPKEVLYRFHGSTRGNDLFIVQIKKDKNGRLELLSIFPWK